MSLGACAIRNYRTNCYRLRNEWQCVEQHIKPLSTQLNSGYDTYHSLSLKNVHKRPIYRYCLSYHCPSKFYEYNLFLCPPQKKKFEQWVKTSSEVTQYYQSINRALHVQRPKACMTEIIPVGTALGSREGANVRIHVNVHKRARRTDGRRRYLSRFFSVNYYGLVSDIELHTTNISLL